MRKMFVFAAAVFVLFSVIISCSKDKASGPVQAGKMILTATPTYTPDVNYTVYIHREGTPAPDVRVEMFSIDDGVALDSYTNVSGTAGFKINSGGKWSVNVGTFKGFKNQYFVVEPLSNSVFAVNYGLPYLDIELIGGSEDIPINPNEVVYEITYHTKFEREDVIRIQCPESINSSYSYPNTVKNDGDAVTCTLNIPKSFEGYGEDKKHLNIWAQCMGDKTIKTEERVLTKNWLFNITADYRYIAVYDHADNKKTSFYACIKNVDVSNSYNIPFTGKIKYDPVDAANYGSAGMTGWEDEGHYMPSFVKESYYDAIAKIKTNMGFDYAYPLGFWGYKSGHENNNGWVKIRIYDDNFLDVERVFSTQNNWSSTHCMHWCCTSRDITRATYECFNDSSKPLILCSFWDKAEIADFVSKKYDNINITY